MCNILIIHRACFYLRFCLYCVGLYNDFAGFAFVPARRCASAGTRSTQPCIPPGSLNRVPASAGGKGGNVTSAGWPVTLCDPIWHVSSRSGVATLRTAIHLLLTYLLAMVLCLRLSVPSQVGCSVETATRIDPVFAWRLSSIYPTR